MSECLQEFSKNSDAQCIPPRWARLAEPPSGVLRCAPRENHAGLLRRLLLAALVYSVRTAVGFGGSKPRLLLWPHAVPVLRV